MMIGDSKYGLDQLRVSNPNLAIGQFDHKMLGLE